MLEKGMEKNDAQICQNGAKMGAKIGPKSEKSEKKACEKWCWNLMPKKIVKMSQNGRINRQWSVSGSISVAYGNIPAPGRRKEKNPKWRVSSGRVWVPRGSGCCERKGFQYQKNKQKKNDWKMEAKGSKREQKVAKKEAKRDQNGAKMGPQSDQNTSKNRSSEKVGLMIEKRCPLD